MCKLVSKMKIWNSWLSFGMQRLDKDYHEMSAFLKDAFFFSTRLIKPHPPNTFEAEEQFMHESLLRDF